MSIFDVAALLLTLSALFGWVNHKIVGLPHTVGLLVMGLLASLVLVVVDLAFPGTRLFGDFIAVVRHIDFNAVVMNCMLAFLVFAGALNVDLSELRTRAWPVFFLAVIGTVISTAVVGAGLWGVANLLGRPMSIAWALVFGALISPTDPVAVLSTLKNVRVPPALEAEMKGEALFNDGVGIVLFAVLLQLATSSSGDGTGVVGVAEMLAWEAGGGIVLGLIAGYIAFSAMRLIDDYPIEIMISLALVTGTYAVAQRFGVSGPLAVVAAGLLIGDRGPRYAMSERTRTYLFGLWNVVDELLNSLLFLLIGLEVLVVRFEAFALVAAVAAVPIVFVARVIAVSVPIAVLPRGMASVRNVPFLAWAGIRGGISVALALSLPESAEKSTLLSATYAVVLFTILVQATTLGFVARRTGAASPSRTDSAEADLRA
jgi:CPA1 family monovalent cation:H+ antiporter